MDIPSIYIKPVVKLHVGVKGLRGVLSQDTLSAPNIFSSRNVKRVNPSRPGPSQQDTLHFELKPTGFCFFSKGASYWEELVTTHP